MGKHTIIGCSSFSALCCALVYPGTVLVDCQRVRLYGQPEWPLWDSSKVSALCSCNNQLNFTVGSVSGGASWYPGDCQELPAANPFKGGMSRKDMEWAASRGYSSNQPTYPYPKTAFLFIIPVGILGKKSLNSYIKKTNKQIFKKQQRKA